MGLDYKFHVEVRAGGSWRVPPSLEPRSKWSHAGEFLWLPGRLRSMDLFFSRHALAPFREEIPPSWESSELYGYFLNFYNFHENEWRISWISYEGLFIDDWRSEHVVVSGKVAVEHAHHFGDGALPFPAAALLEAGIGAWDVDNLRCGHLIEEPINRSYGKRRYDLTVAAPGERVPVSWSDSVWDYLGDDVSSSFLNLRRFGNDSDLRIISTLS